jgi:homoserine dehydrogenase
VYQHLQQLSKFFDVVGIYVRDIHKDRSINVPGALLENDIRKLLTRPYNLLVDVCNDPANAGYAIGHCLQTGRPAVTASKRVTVLRGTALEAMASRHNTYFKYSAAVGGSAPMVETLERVLKVGPITSLRGVLNGTCNYVLDSMSKDVPFEDAVAEAQTCGLTESDVTLDLGGKDSEDKLRILTRLAFGAECDAWPVSCSGLEQLSARQLASAKTRGEVVRLVATSGASGKAAVHLQSLPADDYLAGARGEENRLVISGANGRQWWVCGKGAGRWPTAEAIIADLLDLHARLGADMTPMSDRPSRH